MTMHAPLDMLHANLASCKPLPAFVEAFMSINLKLLAAVVATALIAGAADARTVKWARGADALTLDPHAQNEGPTIAFNNQVYEALTTRDNANKLIPGLAVSWKLAEPTVWEFKLRQGGKFSGGEAFT